MLRARSRRMTSSAMSGVTVKSGLFTRPDVLISRAYAVRTSQ